MKYLGSSAFMMSLALVAAMLTNFTGVFPGTVLTPPVRSGLTIFLLALMMTLALSRIPASNLNPLRRPGTLLRGLLMGLVIPAIMPVAGYLILKHTDYADYATGLIFIAAAPFAASVVPLSLILRGDMVYAAQSTLYVYIAALLWIPLVAFVFLGTLVDMRALVVTVFGVIGVPLILSRFLMRLPLDRAKLAVVLNCVIFFLVWLSVSAADFKSAGAGILLVFMLIIMTRTFGLGIAVNYLDQKAGIGWSQRVTDILMASYKNKGIAIALCVATMGPRIPQAMVAIAASIVMEICWVIYMDSVLFSARKMSAATQAGAAVSV
jgi:BASS family bile acid:Na+ symporter